MLSVEHAAQPWWHGGPHHLWGCWHHDTSHHDRLRHPTMCGAAADASTLRWSRVVGPTSCGTLPIGYVTGSAALTCSPPVLPASWCDPRCPQAEARNPLHVNSHRWCAGTVLPATLPPHRFVHFPCAVPFSPPLCCQHRHRCPVHSHRNRV